MTINRSIRDELRTAVRQAMRDRDRDSVAVLRTALSAIDNAEAVPTDQSASAIEDASVGVGTTEAARHDFTEDQMRKLVAREADELMQAAEYATGQTAETHRRGAELLRRMLGATT